MIPLNSCSLL